MTKIKGLRNWYCSFEMKDKIWYEAPCCCFLVDVRCGFRVGSGSCYYFLVGSGWLLLFSKKRS